jgi:hypothetical protein
MRAQGDTAHAQSITIRLPKGTMRTRRRGRESHHVVVTGFGWRVLPG